MQPLQDPFGFTDNLPMDIALTVLENVLVPLEDSETTFFITEHDMEVVFSVAERIFVVNQGSLLAEGTPEEIRANPEVKRAYLGGSLDAVGL